MRPVGVSRAATKSLLMTEHNDKEQVFLKRQKGKEPRRLLEVDRKMTMEQIFADGFGG